MDYDAVVIGGGHNGLVAANRLCDRGWRVLVLEAEETPGGAVRSGEVTKPGFVSDLFSAFYPLGYASPVLRSLELERHGLRWTRAPAAVAHPDTDGRCALLSTDLDETAASLDAFAAGDGDGWRELYALWRRVSAPLMEALTNPLPPVRPGLRLLSRLGGPRDIVRFVRFAILPVRRMAAEHFRGDGGAWLLGGNAMHADLTPETNGSGMFGWLLCMLGQQFGFPVPVGGSGRLTDALVARLRERGGELRCGVEVERILVRGGRAVGVRTAGGDEISAGRAVLASTTAQALYERLLPREAVPDAVLDELEHFQWDNPTVKVDWALRKPIPWLAPEAGRAGTVHLADGMDGLTRTTSQLACRQIPDHPFLVMGQYSMVDPTRCPPGAEVAWGYTHVPHEPTADAGGEGLSGRWTQDERDRFVERIEAEVEARAPGFRDLILARHAAFPADLERANQNLLHGAVNNGTAQLQQQVVFRPVPGSGRPGTTVDGLYLSSAAIHPGGGVHGGPGNSAARAAIAGDRLRRAGL